MRSSKFICHVRSKNQGAYQLKSLWLHLLPIIAHFFEPSEFIFTEALP